MDINMYLEKYMTIDTEMANLLINELILMLFYFNISLEPDKTISF